MSAPEELIQVIVRCRPMNEDEVKKKCGHAVSIKGQTCIISKSDGLSPSKHLDKKSFTYDKAYPENTTTEQIYKDIVSPVVQSVTEGYNGTIFAYGQTSCGKTYTMQGVPDPVTQQGIIPRAIQDVFMVMTSSQSQFIVHASCYEIYNEEIRDLLGKDSTDRLDIGSFTKRGFYVKGLTKHPVTTVKQCEELITEGLRKRSTGSTLMNSESSRSHTVFTVCVEAQGEGGHIRAGKLNLVDLAGSERQAKSGAIGERLKESIKINLSLHTLGRVISTLAEGKKQIVPYRESKLTKLLQDSLGGTARTLMVACVSPADYNYNETLSTLRFASRAKKIVNKPVINEDPKDALLKEYQAEIRELKAKLEEAGNKPYKIPDIDPQAILTQMERKREEEFENEKKEMEMEYERKLAENEQKLAAMRKQLEARRDNTQCEDNMTRMTESGIGIQAESITKSEEQKILAEIEGEKSLELDIIEKVQSELLLKEREELAEERRRQEEEMTRVKMEMDKMLQQLRQDEEKKMQMIKDDQDRRLREIQQQYDDQLQKEKELKARIKTEIDEKIIYERELQSARDKTEELEVLRKRDIEAARMECERQVEDERRRVDLIRQEKKKEMKTLEEKAKAENERLREEDELLARAVQMIAQQDYDAYLKREAERLKVTGWTCGRCTLVNQHKGRNCQVCRASRSSDGESGAENIEKHSEGDRPSETFFGEVRRGRGFNQTHRRGHQRDRSGQWSDQMHYFPYKSHGREGNLAEQSPYYIGIDDSSNTSELRLVLIGRSGSGKGSTGNNILGNQVFKPRTSVTQRGTGSRFERNIEIIKMPGLFDNPDADIMLEMVKCAGMTAPGPHAFILVVRIDNFTKEDQDTVDYFKKVFGEGVLNFLIILFTKKESMICDGLSLQNYLEMVSDDLKKLLKSCNNRCVAFNNIGAPAERDGDVKELLDLVESTFCSNGGHVYQSGINLKADKVMRIKEEQLRIKHQPIIQREIDAMRREYEKKIKKIRREQDDVTRQVQDRIHQLEIEQRRDADGGADGSQGEVKGIGEWRSILQNTKDESYSETMRLRKEMENQEEELRQKEKQNFRDQARQAVQNWHLEEPEIRDILSSEVTNVMSLVGFMLEKGQGLVSRIVRP